MDQLPLMFVLDHCRYAYDSWHPRDEHTVVERDSSSAVVTIDSDYDGTRLVKIMIAGTNDLEDLYHAAWICEKENRHRGFYLYSLRLIKALQRFVRWSDIVHIYGHSLGGVCAQYLSLSLAEKVRAVNVYSVGAPKGFRYPIDLPVNSAWILWENDLDAIPEYPLTKPFDWGLMKTMNSFNFHRHILVNGDRGEPRGKWRKFAELLSPSLRSLSPRFTLDETVRNYHSLDHYYTFVD